MSHDYQDESSHERRRNVDGVNAGVPETPSEGDLEKLHGEGDPTSGRIVEPDDPGQRGKHVEHRVTREFHSGPLPAPRTLAEYGEIDPTFPERIMRMTEQSQAAQIEIDRKYSTTLGRVTTFGMAGTISVAAIGAIGGTIVVLLGHPEGAFGYVVSALTVIPRIIDAFRGNSAEEE